MAAKKHPPKTIREFFATNSAPNMLASLITSQPATLRHRNPYILVPRSGTQYLNVVPRMRVNLLG